MAHAGTQEHVEQVVRTNLNGRAIARPWIHNLIYGAILASIDMIAVVLAFMIAFLLRLMVLPQFGYVRPGPVPVEPYLNMPWLVLVWCAVFFYEGLYSRGLGHWDELVRIPKSIFFATLLTVGATFVYHTTLDYSRVVLLGTCVVALFTIPVLRTYSKTRVLSLAFPIRVLMFWIPARGHEPKAQIRRLNRCGYKVVNTFPISSHDCESDIRDFVHYVTTNHDPDEIVVDTEGLDEESLRKVLRCVEACGRPVRVLSSLSIFQLQASVRNLDGLVLFDLNHGLARPLSGIVKSTVDMIGAAIILVLCLPVFVILAILIKLDSRGPVFYAHRRLAPGGRTFGCLKFRTMYRDADNRLKEWIESGDDRAKEFQADFKLKNDPRITRVGKILRKLSLDEIPQLINVLRGEMSLVGPRPIVEGEISKYGGDFQYLLTIKAGMTGLWQVSGRNDTDYSERIALDTYYARNWSCWLDLIILMKTVWVVVKRSGAY